mgnify:CR=1 FL=1
MKRRIVSYVLIASVSLMVGGILQPLNHLQALAQQGNCQDFKETGKKLCGKFLQYWQANGGLRQQGFPISNEFREKSDLNGQEYTVQYFERAVFELHPELPAPNDVLLTQLGTFWGRSKYGNPPCFPGEACAPTPVPGPPGAGVPVQLLREGVTITLLSLRFLGGTNPLMVWSFKITNGSKAPVTFELDKTSPLVTDSTGKTYKLITSGSCVGSFNPMGSAFDKPYTIAPNQSIGNEDANCFYDPYLAFQAAGIPTTATYMDVRLTISGQQLTFRHSLK